MSTTSSAATQPQFEAGKEYTFSMRSFRVSNGFMFVSTNGLQILIGAANDYKLSDMLVCKQMNGNVYATFKEMRNINGVDYPAFRNISIG